MNHDMHVYSDGAVTNEDKAGGAFVLYQAGRKVLAESFGINYGVEPIDAEIIAISHGIKTAVQKAPIRFATNIAVFTDNQTAANIVNGKNSLTSRKEILEIRKSQEEWKSRSRFPHIQPGNIFACWIPGHANTPGNEEADRLAKQGAQNNTEQNNDNKMSHAVVKKLINSIRSTMVTDWWNTHAPNKYKILDIGIDHTGKPPEELQIERKILGLLIAARSGYGDFKSYHERFGHETYESCTCGADKTPIHFFFCRLTKNKAKGEVGKRRPREAIDWLLGSPQGATAFSRRR
ncbi:hypothetical protein EV44_g3523 [Erysiphe necator]|uniref:RNase H type-1 domain-containing protein n=1 Tax=Uncinula necator TaxID=52586 RepID=A0A0B1P4Z2_UNCNE|nr:hypothetical protein EV44_g3523 [Erysiphe necator]